MSNNVSNDTSIEQHIKQYINNLTSHNMTMNILITNSEQICMAARIVGVGGKSDTTSHDVGVEIVANALPLVSAWRQ